MTILYILLGIIIVLLIIILVTVNNGFIFTNNKIDGYANKNLVLIDVADKIMSKYKIMTKAIREDQNH